MANSQKSATPILDQVNELLNMASFYEAELIEKKLELFFSKEVIRGSNVLKKLPIPMAIYAMAEASLVYSDLFAKSLAADAQSLEPVLLAAIRQSTPEIVSFHQLVRDIIEQNKSRRFEIEIKREGNLQYFSLTIEPFMVLDQEVIMLLTPTTTAKRIFEIQQKLQSFLERLSHIDLDKSTFLNEMVHDAVRFIGKSAYGSIVLINEANELEWHSLCGYEDESLIKTKMPFEQSIQWIIGKDAISEAFRIDDFTDLPEILPLLYKLEDQSTMKSMISAPLFMDKKLIGYVNVDSKVVKCFDDIDVMALQLFADACALKYSTLVLNERLNQMANVDPMTGLGLVNTAMERLHRIQNDKLKGQTLGVYVIKILGLERLNDRYGWNVGNEAIVSVARKLAMLEGENLNIYRLSGKSILVLETHPIQNESSIIIQNYTNKVYLEGCQLSVGLKHIPLIVRHKIILNVNVNLFELLDQIIETVKIDGYEALEKMPIY